MSNNTIFIENLNTVMTLEIFNFQYSVLKKKEETIEKIISWQEEQRLQRQKEKFPGIFAEYSFDLTDKDFE